MLEEKERQRILKGLSINLDHNPASPWRSINDLFGLQMIQRPESDHNSGGQLIGASVVIRLRPPIKLEASKSDGFLPMLIAPGRIESYIGLLCLNSTLDHESIHFDQVFSEYGLKEYSRIERRNLAWRLIRSGRVNEIVEAMPSCYEKNLWLLEAPALIHQYYYLSCPERVLQVELDIQECSRLEPAQAETLSRLARPVMGELLYHSLKRDPKYILAWNFINQCTDVFARSVGLDRIRTSIPDKVFVGALIANLAMFRGLGPEEILKVLSKIKQTELQLLRDLSLESIKSLGINLTEWKSSVLSELQSQLVFFQKFGVKGQIERTSILLDLVRKMPSENQVKIWYNIFDVFKVVEAKIVLSGLHHYIGFVPGGDSPPPNEDYLKTLAGGFIDTHFSDQMATGKPLKCPFARSPQSLWGCLNCSGLIDGEDLNHSCPHARRWLE